MKNDYSDIINLPHHVSKKRPQMSRRDRAAQFSPFAALTGYEDSIDEAARLTGKKRQLDDEKRFLLDCALQYITDNISLHPEITVRYFVPDEKKDGGSYNFVTGKVKSVDSYRQTVLMQDGLRIAFDDIYSIDY